MPKLVIFDEAVRGVELPDHGVIVGRSRKVDIPIDDRLLSRKHCTIVPGERFYRVIDLKSANGTYLNGQAIDKAELEFDDVLEIGSTVMVFLDTETWKRGEGLTRLRNPVKAQELVQRLNAKAGSQGKVSSESVFEIPFDSPETAAKNTLQGSSVGVSKELAEQTARELAQRPELVELLARYLEHEVARSLLARLPDLQEELVARLEERLTGSPDEVPDLAGEIRQVLLNCVEQGTPDGPAD